MSDYNKLRDIRIGLEIFERHGGTVADAEHDILHAGQNRGAALGTEEIAKLYQAGWFIPSDSCYECAEQGDKDAHCDPDARGGEIRYHRPNCNEWAIFT